MELNPVHTFESFVTGPSNRLACTACRAVVDSLGTSRCPSPLFIQAKAGLGKTHLLQATCRQALARHPDAKVCFISCEALVNEFIQAARAHRVEDFRASYCGLDMLAVDDVAFLSGKESSQEELLHILNDLHQRQKQIVLSSDIPLAEIPGMNERLLALLNSGLVAKIEFPCLETRLAIVRMMAESANIKMPKEVARLVAESCVHNVRELQGTVIKLAALSQITDGTITRALAEEALPQRQRQGTAARGPRHGDRGSGEPGDRLILRAFVGESVDEVGVVNGAVELIRALNAYHIACGGSGLTVDDWQIFAPRPDTADIPR